MYWRADTTKLTSWKITLFWEGGSCKIPFKVHSQMETNKEELSKHSKYTQAQELGVDIGG